MAPSIYGNKRTRRAPTSTKVQHLKHTAYKYNNKKSLIHGLIRIITIYLFWVLCRFQHCTGHITKGSWKGRGNQYIQLVKVLYYKLPYGKQLPVFPLEAVPGTEPRPQRWEARVLPLCHRGPSKIYSAVPWAIGGISGKFCLKNLFGVILHTKRCTPHNQS